MTQIKFRASSAAMLLTEPRSKVAKDKGELSKTSQSLIEKMWLRKKYKFDEPVFSKEMLKGIELEQKAMQLLDKVKPEKDFRTNFRRLLASTYSKDPNDKYLKGIGYNPEKGKIENEYFTGMPDIVLPTTEVCEDVKVPWSIKTFIEKRELEKMYFTQGQVYMYLLGLKKFRIHYCLLNTPAWIVFKEKEHFYYKFGANDEHPQYIEAAKKIDRNHNYNDIPDKEKIRTFEFEYDETHINRLIDKIEKAREYYNSLKLGF